MTENPFGAGGFDMNTLLEQAQQMQAQLASAQAELADARVEGEVAGGDVAVTVNGVGDLLGVRIAVDTFDGSSIDDLEDLSDLIVAAFNDAKTKVEQLAAQKLGPMAGGLPGLG